MSSVMHIAHMDCVLHEDKARLWIADLTVADKRDMDN